NTPPPNATARRWLVVPEGTIVQLSSGPPKTGKVITRIVQHKLHCKRRRDLSMARTVYHEFGSSSPWAFGCTRERMSLMPDDDCQRRGTEPATDLTFTRKARSVPASSALCAGVQPLFLNSSTLTPARSHASSV